MTNYDYSLWFYNINIDKSSLNQENSFIIRTDQNVLGEKNKKKEGIIQRQ